MGFRGIPSADVIFDDVGVPEENLLIGLAASAGCSARSPSSAWATRR